MENELSINDIQTYLDDRKTYFLRILKQIKNMITDYWQYNKDGISGIYRVATRGDYQFGNELKTSQSIYSKILDKRSEEGNANYNIESIEDIIGVRIVCVYPSDVFHVLEYLSSLHDEGFFYYYHCEYVEKETGYRAYHINVSLDDMQLRNYKCEIQVVTMLQETWSYKAHELIYKPEEYITEDQIEHASSMSEILHACDKQSQLLHNQIISSSEEENTRKELAKIALSEVIAKLDPEKEKELCEIRDYILKNKEKLHRGDSKHVLQKIGEYIQKNGIDLSVCKVIMLLCTIREQDDLDLFAIDNIEKLISNITQKDELVNVYRFAGLSYYCLSIPEKAVEKTQQALTISEEIGDKYQSNILKSNIAYFIADSRLENMSELAKKYSQEANESLPDNVDIMDTFGYVKIVFGDTYEKVNEGLQKCEESYKKETNKELAKPYFELHRRKAYQRLWHLQPTSN